jgi:hypothetical protein
VVRDNERLLRRRDLEKVLLVITGWIPDQIGNDEWDHYLDPDLHRDGRKKGDHEGRSYNVH